MSLPILQVALDLLDLERALVIANEAVAGGADWLEAGTPLIKSEGMKAVRELRSHFPGKIIVADMKIADTGSMEVEMAAKAGASIVVILSTAEDVVIKEAVKAASQFGVQVMADLINDPDPLMRAKTLESLGVDLINAHVGIDGQMIGHSSIELLSALAGQVHIPLAVAGGLDSDMAAQAVRSGAGIVIVGGWITRSADVTGATRRIRASIDVPGHSCGKEQSPDMRIRELLSVVSTSNISDAMHRKGAMNGIFAISKGVRAVGKAVTVQTVAGDWAKPVEAIDIADPGDIIVINNDGVRHVAPWGELATLSCIQRGVSGVVIDGAVRDVDEIRKLRFPVFATSIVPNAGEPKGFGEINAEIRCAGQQVRPGDWIVCDENGVVVIPKEHAYEIARRALEVWKNEERIREEIKRGSTLSKVAELKKWEKK